MYDYHFRRVSVLVAFSSRLGYEEHIPGQTRDWNEELQTSRELPRKNLPERLIRERAIFKVLNSDISLCLCNFTKISLHII